MADKTHWWPDATKNMTPVIMPNLGDDTHAIGLSATVSSMGPNDKIIWMMGADGNVVPVRAVSNGDSTFRIAADVTGASGDSTFVWRGDWSSVTAYVENDVVAHNGSSWIALQDNTNVTPGTDALIWGLVAQNGDTGAQGIQGAVGPEGPQGDPGPSVIPTSTAFAPGIPTEADATSGIFALADGTVAISKASGEKLRSTNNGVVITGLLSVNQILASGLIEADDITASGDVNVTGVVRGTNGVAGQSTTRTLGTGALDATAGNDARLSDARTPTGTAGGGLTGTYPNPTLADGAVSTAAKIVDGVISRSKIAEMPKAYAFHNATQSIVSSGVIQTLIFNDEQYDTDSIHDIVSNNGRLTVPFTGKYIVFLWVPFANNGVGLRYIDVVLNAAAVLWSIGYPAASGLDQGVLLHSQEYPLTATWFLDARVFQTSGGALDVLANAAFGIAWRP